MKRLPIIIVLLLWAGAVHAQTTTVSATVVDPTGNPYVNGSFTAQFYDPGTSGKIPLINGSTFQTVLAGQLDSFGFFSTVVTDNLAIASSSGATNTTWIFSICSQTYSTLNNQKFCFSWTAPLPGITGPAMNISAQLKAVAATLPTNIGGGSLSVNGFPVVNANLQNNANCTWLVVGSNVTSTCTATFLGGTIPNPTTFSSLLTLPAGFTSSGPNTLNGVNTLSVLGNAALKNGTADALCYATTTGNDTNDGLSWGTPKLTIYGCEIALPGGSSSGPVAGSGTIYYTDGVGANPTANCGIWLMGSADPNFASPPACWVKYSNGSAGLTIIGVPKTDHGPNPHMAKALFAGGSSADLNHPAFYLSSIAGALAFENMANQYPGRGIVIGECSNQTRTATCNSSGIEFDNVTVNLNDVAGNGPCTDVTGQSFWIWFKDWGCSGTDDTNSPSSDKAASMLIDGRTNAGVGLIFVRDANTDNGGIKLYAGTNFGQVVVDGLTTEGQKTEPAVEIAATGGSGDKNVTADIRNVQVADATGTTPALENDILGGSVVAYNTQGQGINIVGQVTILGQYPQNLAAATKSPLQNGQLGFFGKTVVGQNGDMDRLLSPTPVRYANLASTASGSWTTSFASSVSSVAACADPAGGTLAGCITYVSGGQAETAMYYAANTPIVSGDWYAVTALIKSTTANGYSGNTPVEFVLNAQGYGSGDICNSVNGIASASSFFKGDGQWERVWALCQVTAAPSNAGLAMVGLTDSTHNLAVYGPTLIHIGTGTVSTNEAWAIASALQPYSNACSVGQLCTVTGPFAYVPSTLTAKVIPQASATFPFLTNSSPQLDNITANTLTYAGSGGIVAPNLTSSALTSGNCVQAGSGGILGTVSGPCSTGGTVNNPNGSFTQGGNLVAANSGVGAASSQAYLDCSVFSGADWTLKVQACLSALNTLNSTAGIADARGIAAGGTTGSINPEGGTMPASGTLLLGPGTYTINVPFVDHADWSVQGVSVRGVDGAVGTTIKAGASFQATYTTGTITMGTAGASETVTGSSTTWTSSMVGCAFYGANNATNSSFGIVTAVGSSTSLTLGWGTNNGTGAAAASSYTILCPIHAHGSGSASSAGDQFGMASIDMNYDCNNVAGCIPDLNWFGNQGTYDLNVGLHNFLNIGLDLENQIQQSGPWSGIVVSPGTGCSSTILPIVIRGTLQAFRGLTSTTVGKGACSTFPAVGIDVEDNNATLSALDLEGVTIGVDVNDTIACPIVCAQPNRLTNGVEIDGVVNQNAGTTLVKLGNGNGTPQGTIIRNLASSVTTSILIDSFNSCTDTDNRLASYTTNTAGAIIQSTSTVAGCGVITPGSFTSANITVNANGQVTAAANGSGGDGTPGSPSLSFQYNNGGVFGGITPATTNGLYYPVENVTANVATAPQLFQVGMGGRAITGASTSDLIAFSDVGSVVNQDVGASGTVTETLPTATTLLNPAFAYVESNHSAQTLTVSPSTWTIQQGTLTAASTLALPPGAFARIKPDPNSSTNWLADVTFQLPVSTKVLGSNASAQPIAATAANVYGLWSGSCTSSTYLRGDGSCQTPAGSGTVTTSGSPASPEIACFSAATVITNCNLSQDVTTSNSAVATVVQVEGAAIPASASVIGTNSSKQLVAATATQILGAATGGTGPLLVSGVLDGDVPVTITTGTSATLGAATYQSGYTMNQEATAGTGVTYTLPATVKGMQYCIANSGTTGVVNIGILTVYPPSSSFVILNGVVNAVGGGGTHGVVSGGAAGDAACFVAIDSTHWQVWVGSGTWTEN